MNEDELRIRAMMMMNDFAECITKDTDIEVRIISILSFLQYLVEQNSNRDYWIGYINGSMQEFEQNINLGKFNE